MFLTWPSIMYNCSNISTLLYIYKESIRDSGEWYRALWPSCLNQSFIKTKCSNTASIVRLSSVPFECGVLFLAEDNSYCLASCSACKNGKLASCKKQRYSWQERGKVMPVLNAVAKSNFVCLICVGVSCACLD